MENRINEFPVYFCLTKLNKKRVDDAFKGKSNRKYIFKLEDE